MTKISSVVFDIGKVLFDWDLRFLYRKLIDDPDELEWFVTNVVTPEWHFQHDAGRPIAEMVPERITEFPEHRELIAAYGTRLIESIPGPIPGSHAIVEELAANGVPLFAITNFGHDFWNIFRPTQPIFDHFRDIIVSGTEKLMKPDAAIYELALRRFDIAPGIAIFIDDNAANVCGASENGFLGYQFTDAQSLRAELVTLGLLK